VRAHYSVPDRSAEERIETIAADRFPSAEFSGSAKPEVALKTLRGGPDCNGRFRRFDSWDSCKPSSFTTLTRVDQSGSKEIVPIYLTWPNDGDINEISKAHARNSTLREDHRHALHGNLERIVYLCYLGVGF